MKEADDLSALREATRALAAPPHLRERVMAAVKSPRPLFAVAVLWAARGSLALGALAAAAAALLAVRAEHAFTAALGAASLGFGP
jgi:hypothetical protein